MTSRRRTVVLGLAAAAAHQFPLAARAATLHKVNTSKTQMVFEPAEIRIKKGDSVQWRNRSIVRNSVTCDPKKAKNPESVALPAGARPFDSGLVGQDVLFTHRFTVAGTYRYFCIEHETMGMIGTVIVE